MEFSGDCFLYGLTFTSLVYLGMVNKRKETWAKIRRGEFGSQPCHSATLCDSVLGGSVYLSVHGGQGLDQKVSQGHSRTGLILGLCGLHPGCSSEHMRVTRLTGPHMLTPRLVQFLAPSLTQPVGLGTC